jgi:hypothetical protein
LPTGPVEAAAEAAELSEEPIDLEAGVDQAVEEFEARCRERGRHGRGS